MRLDEMKQHSSQVSQFLHLYLKKWLMEKKIIQKLLIRKYMIRILLIGLVRDDHYNYMTQALDI